MSLKLENPNGQAIQSFADWLPLAHPPDADVEWKDFHSAGIGAGLLPGRCPFCPRGNDCPAG